MASATDSPGGSEVAADLADRAAQAGGRTVTRPAPTARAAALAKWRDTWRTAHTAIRDFDTLVRAYSILGWPNGRRVEADTRRALMHAAVQIEYHMACDEVLLASVGLHRARDEYAAGTGDHDSVLVKQHELAVAHGRMKGVGDALYESEDEIGQVCDAPPS